MGMTRTFKYRVEIKETKCFTTSSGWRCNVSGRPTEENLETLVRGLEASYQPGGVNEHIGRAFGFDNRVSYACIVDQRENRIVAEYHMPKAEELAA